MGLNVSSLKRKLQEYAHRADKAGKATARVGFLGDQGPDGNKYQYEDGTSVAYVAAIQEYGAPERSIPARPFMRPTVKEQQKTWASHIAKGTGEVIKGRISGYDVMDAVGELAASDMKMTISNIQSPPLSPVTIMLRGMKHHDADLHVTGRTVGEAADRVRQGKTNYGASTKPLEDTFTLYDTLTHDVTE